PRSRLLVLVLLIGIGSGVCAFALKWKVGTLSANILARVSDHHTWLLLIIPFCALVVTALICFYIFRADLSNGVSQIKNMLRRKDYFLGASRIPYTLAASSITLGLGGSAGGEGPMAYTGAAIASTLGRASRLSPQQMLLLLGCGAGAGIAAIFKSPLGGALFTIEVLQIGFTAYGIILLFVCSITAGLTSYILGGCHPDVIISGLKQFDAHLLPALILLGLFCGIYSIYYSYLIKWTARWLSRIPRPWMQVAIAGVILSILIAIFPALYSEGYGVAAALGSGDNSSLISTGIINIGNTPWAIVLIALLILLVKSMATSLTNNGGGVSGDFAPTIFAGAVAGYLFAFVANTIFGLHLPVNQIALYGMAAVMAGAIRAPLMAIIIVVEMTGAIGHFLPISIVAGISYFTVRAFTLDSYGSM
ncbi:MAG: chloride channel protein, partial [Paramuribaculum sp.]|nr:chloride channel protein [Paramuribaculum sp.]